MTTNEVRTEYGIPADERQKLEHYRAAYRAYWPMMLVSFAGFIVGWIIENDALTWGMAAVTFTGMIIFGTLLEKSGWEEYVRERIANDPEVRRRALRGVWRYGAMMAVFWFVMQTLTTDGSVLFNAISSVLFGAVCGFTQWWLEIRRARRMHASTTTSSPNTSASA